MSPRFPPLPRLSLRLLALALLCSGLGGCAPTSPSGAVENRLTREAAARGALQQLYSTTPEAAVLGRTAAGILVFPEITKGGFLIGGQYGTGVLFTGGQVVGYYRSAAASYGLQAGVQRFGYALFFMSHDALEYLDRSGGWEVGVGPSVTVVDEGFARTLSTTTARKGVYAFFFNQRGLMAGMGIQGSRIRRTEPGP